MGTPRGRGRRIGLLALLAALIALGVTLMPMTAGAVHNGPFELDGNALDSNGNATTPDDWGTLFPTDNSSTDLGHSFVTDKTGASDDGFGSGLTKDTQDVSNWTAVTGGISPEKDDILHAYAATYVAGANQLLYFGQDRAPKPNGSTSMGFWFFQDEVGPNGSGGFTGHHIDGDILVTSDMTNGGAVSVVNVFKWQSGGLVQVANLLDADCGDSPDPDTACGIANEGQAITVPWDYPTPTVPENIFFEGGIDLTAIFGGSQNIPCFSSFLANTRTSPSETADLKDFVAGNLDTCGTITIHKNSVPDSGQDFSFDSNGTGLSDFSLEDDGDNNDELKNTVEFTGLSQGAYSVAELGPLPAGWTNTDLVCTKEGPGTDVTTSGTNAGRTATITLGQAGNVDCTFTNTFTKQNPSVATDIHNTDHQTITSAPIGSSVHDKATVSGVPGFAAPTGNVGFTVYLGNTTCSGDGTSAGAVALDGSGVAHPSNTSTVPSGGLSYKAHYEGDAIYNAADGPCETLGATKLNSSTTTDVHNADHGVVTSAPIGSTVHDKATVTGTQAGGTPTGTVTFTVYMGNSTCSGQGSAAGTVTLDGSGVAHPSNSATVPVGGLSYKAHYNGSAVYNESDGACEPLAGDKIPSSTATDVHNAGHDVITHAPIGSTVHDKATVSGALTTPTGTVDFTVYMGNSQCEGQGTAAGSVALSGGVAHPSNTAVVPVGGLSYRAHYNGDDTYEASTGPCEPLAGDKLDSTTATDIHVGAGNADQANATPITSAPIGSTVHDKATVSGALTTPTGTVEFTVYLGNSECEGQGTAAGSVALSGGVAHPSSDATVPVGGLSFRAQYSGDDTYKPSTGPCEPLTGGKLSSSTVTAIHDADHEVVTSVPAGTTVHDQATVSGGLGTPTGTVTFKWFMNDTCSGDVAATSTAVALVNGVADATDFTFTPTVAGGRSFQATYSGDSTYEGSTGDCEPLEVGKVDSTTVTDIHDADHEVVTSAPLGSTVHDLARVTGQQGLPTPTGNVSFTVYSNSECEGEGSAAGTVALAGGVAHPSDNAVVDLGGLSFKAQYGGDDTYKASTGACEPLQVQKGTLTVVKDFVGAPEGATVTLRIRHGQTVEESGRKGDGGSISKQLAPGTYTAEEISAAGDVNLGLYNSSIECVENGEGGEVVVPSKAGTSAEVDLGNGDDITCTITNTHVLPSISVTKSPSPSQLQEPGGNVTYTITVKNTSPVDPITITSLVDDKFGDLTAACGIPGAKWQLAPGASATCTITRPVSGNPSTPHTNTVTASGHDEGGNQASAQASATVTFTATPPPPPPPPPPPHQPLIDLAVTKVDTPDPAQLNGQITYTMVVSNNGPDTATQVTAADPLPAGTSFVSVSTTQGTCANGNGLIQCSLGTIAKGGSVTITLVVRATQAGVLTNEVTVVGKEPESNVANNRATATTFVPTPLTPPTPKPKPKPKPLPAVCSTLTVGPKTLSVGKRSTIAAVVKNRGKGVKGAKVVVRGPGLAKTGRTNAGGVARITVKPVRPGIVTVSVSQKLTCGAKRIGVVGVFEPPVTG